MLRENSSKERQLCRQLSQYKKSGQPLISLNHNLQGPKEIDSIAVLVGVGDELSVEFLVTGKVDATSLLVILLNVLKKGVRNKFFHLDKSETEKQRNTYGEKLVVGIVDFSNVGESGSADAVKPVLIYTNKTVT